jgi:hypothetical protein
MTGPIFYADTRIQITETLVTVDGVNYSLAKINKLGTSESLPDRMRAKAIMLAGFSCFLIAAVPLVLILSTLSERSNLASQIFPLIFISLTILLGLALFLAGRKGLADRRPNYTLTMETNTGNINLLSSRNPEYIHQVERAIRRALAEIQ